MVSRLFMLLGLVAISSQSTFALVVTGIERKVIEGDQETEEWLRDVVREDQRAIANRVLDDPTLVVSSIGTYGCPPDLYTWSYDQLVFLASFGNQMGDSYSLEARGQDRYFGDDGKGLEVEFAEAHRDDRAIVYTGSGKVTVMGIPSGGTFVNVIRYAERPDGFIDFDAYIYVRVNNSLKRFVAKVVFAVSDLEETIKEKLFEMDGTLIRVLRQLLDDPELVPRLRADPTAEEALATRRLAAWENMRNPAQQKKERRIRQRKTPAAEPDTFPPPPTLLPLVNGLPVLEGPLLLKTVETAALLRNGLAAGDFDELRQILTRFYTEDPLDPQAESVSPVIHPSSG